MKRREELPLTTPEITTLPPLSDLESLSRKDLLILFKKLYRHPAPRHSSQQFLISHCAWAIQALQTGRDPISLRGELLQKLEEKFGKGSEDPLNRYKPGTRLIREWQGVVHEVVITKEGYIWQEKVFTGLSPIANAITGSRWSGPRFFGINKQSSLNGRKQERLKREGSV